MCAHCYSRRFPHAGPREQFVADFAPPLEDDEEEDEEDPALLPPLLLAPSPPTHSVWRAAFTQPGRHVMAPLSLHSHGCRSASSKWPGATCLRLGLGTCHWLRRMKRYWGGVLFACVTSDCSMAKCRWSM